MRNSHEKTYKDAVSTYEDLLKLRDQNVKIPELEKDLAGILKSLSDRDYSSASSKLTALHKSIDKKNADTPGSEITDSKLEANKAPLDLDDSVESIKEVERSNDGRRKAKKHSLTPEQLKKKKEIIEKVLKYGSNKERKEAMRELAHLSTDGLEDLVKIVSETLINDEDNGIKVSCLRTLAELEVKTESKNIIDAMKNKSDDVKDAAIHAILKLKIEEASEELGSFLKNQDFTKSSTLVSSTINTLAELQSGKSSSEFLENKLKDKTTSLDLRSSIALYIAKIKDNKAESALIEVAIAETTNR